MKTLRNNPWTRVAPALVLIVSALARAEPATDESLRTYFKMSGQEAAATENANRILPALRQLSKDMPEDLWQELTRTDRIVSRLISVYRRHFSEEDVQELIAFYNTPIGKKFATKSSVVQREMLEQGARETQAAIINYQVQKGRFTIEPAKTPNSDAR